MGHTTIKGPIMKKLLLLGVVLASSLFAFPARADVDTRIGFGEPHFLLTGGKHDFSHRHYHPPKHRHYSSKHRRHSGPPTYYPEKVYRHRKPHHPYYGHHKHVRPPVYGYHFNHGRRPAPPPHARAHLWRH